MSHDLVPDFKILTKKQKEKVMEKYNMSDYDFPRILADDPVVKALGAKIGELLEITRESKTAGTTVYYRIVQDAKGGVVFVDTSETVAEEDTELDLGDESSKEEEDEES